VLQSGIKAWFTPRIVWSVFWSCIHVGFKCVYCIVRPCAYCICMVWVMVAVRLPWEVDGVVVECMTNYKLFMHISIHICSSVQ